MATKEEHMLQEVWNERQALLDRVEDLIDKLGTVSAERDAAKEDSRLTLEEHLRVVAERDALKSAQPAPVVGIMENERLRARVSELEREASMTAEHQVRQVQRVAELEARLAKVDALALSAFQIISQPSMNYAECAHLAQKLALLAPEVT